MKSKKLIWVLLMIFAFLVSGCGSGNKSTASVAAGQMEAPVFNDNSQMKGVNEGSRPDSEPSPAEKENGAPAGGSALEYNSINQKVIFTGHIGFETLNFEKTRNDILNYISSIDGYVQNSSVQGGGIGYQGLIKAEYTFRIPKTKYMQTFNDIRKFGTVVFEQSSGEDITDRYFDTEARLKSLKIQQERLQALLEKAGKMEDILKIEKELQTVMYEIENYTGTIKKWDSLIEYSTLIVNISEVEQIKPAAAKENDGFMNRMAVGFSNSATGLWEFLQDLIVFLVSALPVIIPLGIVGYLVYRFIKRRTGKVKNNMDE